MSSPTRTAHRLRRKADGSIEMAEFQAELVEGVKGMDPGFRLGTVTWGDSDWEVIIHQVAGGDEYSVRQAGKDEDDGFIVRVPKNNAAKFIMDHGFLLGRKNPPPLNEKNLAVLTAQHGQLTYMLQIRGFVNAVLLSVGMLEEPEGDEGVGF